MRPPVQGDDARIVGHLIENRHVTRSLEMLHIVVVGTWTHWRSGVGPHDTTRAYAAVLRAVSGASALFRASGVKEGILPSGGSTTATFACPVRPLFSGQTSTCYGCQCTRRNSESRYSDPLHGNHRHILTKPFEPKRFAQVLDGPLVGGAGANPTPVPEVRFYSTGGQKEARKRILTSVQICNVSYSLIADPLAAPQQDLKLDRGMQPRIRYSGAKSRRFSCICL